ncbi:hypothetical protein [Gallibacterium genomosp. 1]|uniref:Uncharacterized protein n=1 Tax=Gallibacterium genomosp. 1 TaxID=155515 RepID=A0AB36DTM3_9PAST|nr:hypothetical protein [Gallibacterium genomosp. 1]OBW98149.1 hypothetical protein QV04_09745 [Gallibacterium genomosp. 1]OBW98676.1 hypothetical protein QV05_10510 [Gallibacterium genomosp. 1]
MSFICIRDDGEKAVWLRKEDIVSITWDQARETLIIQRGVFDADDGYDLWEFEQFTQQEYMKLIQQF